MVLIGVDIGTQGTKTALYDARGVLLAEAGEASVLARPRPGVVEEDPERQVLSVCRTVKECLERAGADPGDVAGIAIDGQMAGVIGVDADGQAVTPYDSWLDTRCAPQIALMSERAGRRVVEQTGCPPSFNHGPKMLWWNHEHPEVFKRIAAFVQPGGYAAMRLCGLRGHEAFIDTTYLHFSGFADNRNSCWDADLCAEFALPEEKLPRIVPPQQIVGRVCAEMAAQSGLVLGTPVVAGCGDTAASFLSSGATREGVCVDVAGTASVFAATTNEFRPDTVHNVLGCGHAVTPGLWHPYAYINGGGMNLEWFAGMLSAGAQDSPAITFDELNTLAERVADPAALPYFVPHLGGRVMPPTPNLRGAWIGLDWSHGVGELFRAMLEGVALEYAIYRDVLEELDPAFAASEMRVTGGGERSALWNRIKASVLETPVVAIDGGGGAPMGSALLAAFGVGVTNRIEVAADDWVSAGTRTEPDPDLVRVYADRKGKYQELITMLSHFHGS